MSTRIGVCVNCPQRSLAYTRDYQQHTEVIKSNCWLIRAAGFCQYLVQKRQSDQFKDTRATVYYTIKQHAGPIVDNITRGIQVTRKAKGTTRFSAPFKDRLSG